jgi:glycosyltransferase involved in cell wall biosynthesis
MKVYGLVPAYNEENTIQEVISQLRRIHIVPVVVDDGSSDRTGELAKKAKAIVLSHKKNEGKAKALQTGFRYILQHKDVGYIVVVDADLQYSPKDSLKLLKPLKKGVDFVIGYRNWGQNWKSIPLRHRLGINVWRYFFNLFFKTKLRDTSCGFLAFKRNAAEKIKNFGKGYTVESSMLMDALKNNLRIQQVPVKVNYKRKSGVFRGIKIELNVLIFIIKEGFKYRLGIK